MRFETGTCVVRGAGFALGVGLVALLGLLAIRGGEVLLLVFLAILLGAALEPVVGWIRERTGFGRGLAILVVFASFLAVVVFVAIVVVPSALVQIGGALGRLPAFLETLRANTVGLRPKALADGIGSLLDALGVPLRASPTPDPEAVLDASIAVASAGAAILTLLVLVFFWLTERARLQRYALAFAPLERREGIRDGWNEVEARLGLWVRGQLILMAALGAATAVAYTVIGLPAALLLALIAAIAEVIPIVGPLIGAVPALLMATTVGPSAVLATLGVYAVIQLVEGNVLVPIVMRNSIGLSPFLVLVSLLVGWTAGGILGATVAVPVVAGIEVVLARLQDRDTPVPIDPNAVREDERERESLKSPPDAPGTAKRRRRSRATTG